MLTSAASFALINFKDVQRVTFNSSFRTIVERDFSTTAPGICTGFYFFPCKSCKLTDIASCKWRCYVTRTFIS